MENLALSYPITNIQVYAINLDWQNNLVTIRVGSGDVIKDFVYEGNDALGILLYINKANASVKSLHRQALEKLIADGKLAGVISGSPD